MEFGIWLQNIRKERQLDIRELAKMSGVDMSTISRIENLKTDATLYTSFRICRSLEISLSKLIEILADPYPLALEEKSFSETGTIITLHDIEDFVGSFFSKKLVYCGHIADSLNFISYQIKGRENRKLSFSLFSANEIDKLLFDTALYRFELKYPLAMKASDMYFIYKHQGAMVLDDVIAYVRTIYSQISHINLGLASTSDSVNHLSARALSRVETSTLERIRLTDVLILDKQLKQGGNLMGMFWEVSRFYGQFSQSRYRQKNRNISNQQMSFDDLNDYDKSLILEENRFELASIYITISRWYIYLMGIDYKWDKFPLN